MERRKFIAISATAVVALGLPTGCSFFENYEAHIGIMPKPAPLARFCSPEDLKKMGTAYIKQISDEDDISALGKQLFKGDDGKLVSATQPVLEKLFQEKIQKDFQADNTLILDGWVLSRTEGRICAALSLV